MDTLNNVLGRLLRWGRSSFRLPRRLEWAFPEFPEEVRRPGIFALLFWGALAMPFVSWGVAWYFSAGRPVGLVLAMLAACALTALWLLLPWDPRTSLRRKLAAPAFLAGVFVMGRILPGSTVLFYPIAFANGVFLFGFRRGIAYAAATLAVIFVDGALAMWLVLSSPTSWGVVTINSLLIVAVYAAVAVFVIGICMSIVEANRRREETNALLGELESAHAELKEYAARVRVLAVSEERIRMAREIHDGLGHYLTAVNLRLEHARRSRSRRPEEAWEEVGEAKGLVSSALSEMRRAVRALKPLDLEERSGAGALNALARSFEGTGREVSFRVEGSELALSEGTELTLYRAMQEGLTNALKHSSARRVFATLTFEEGNATLMIADDGEGAPNGAPEEGFGLRALRERVEELGGTLEAGTAPGEEGFVLRVRLPADPEAERR